MIFYIFLIADKFHINPKTNNEFILLTCSQTISYSHKWMTCSFIIVKYFPTNLLKLVSISFEKLFGLFLR